MKLRVIKEHDIVECAGLFCSVFSSPPWNEAWTVTLALKRLQYFYESKGFIGVLCENDEIISFALGTAEPYCNEQVFYLREMCTKKSEQNNGLGGILMDFLERELKNHCITSVYLTTKRGIPAANFYTKKGFTCSDSTRVYEKHIMSEG